MPNVPIAFLASAITAFVVTPLLLRALLARGIYGHSRIREGVEHNPVPRLGGVAVCVATTAALLLALGLSEWGAGLGLKHPPATFFGGLLLAGWLAFGAGVVDDLYNLPPKTKLLAQVAAALIAWQAGFRIEQFTLFGTVELAALSLPVTVLWIVGVTNAFNLIDGLDGLATAIALVALSTTLALSLALGNWAVALVCAALAGALVGFFPYNFRPARIFLGDSGSLFVGFMLAVLSVHGATKSATAVLTVVPVLVLALPLLDTGLAIVRRWLRGRPIFGADERHLHHRLLAIGVTRTRAAVLLAVLASALAMFGLVLFFAPPRAVWFIALAGGVLCLAMLLFAIKRLGYHEFVEAGAVVASGPGRLRRAIRDRIHARDLTHVLAHAESIEHLRAILVDNAEVMGLLALSLCRSSSGEGLRDSLPREAAPAALKVDFPVPVDDDSGADPWVLRAWCDGADPHALPDAVRVVHVLAVAVREWMERGPARRLPHGVAMTVPGAAAG
ncbi:MAG TPA: MraY family glycosyltransferase [Longimicrobium sp.]|nr:MraY family glycosyltransferase [Longimicrobium sp.]